jgi:tRNA pseudouridine38-40 synthase
MQAAARLLEGTHDFTAFRSEHCDAENPLRTIHSFDVIPAPPFLFLDVRANAFLRSQVRIMAGTLLEIGLGRLSRRRSLRCSNHAPAARPAPHFPRAG